MLTRDENIGSVEVVVYYQIVDPKDYLFNVVNPLDTLKQAAESALRQVVGQSTLNEVLTGGQIAPSIKKQIIATLKNYDMGIAIFDVMLKTAKGPEEVQTAFDDVIRAREEAERFINQAKSYANDVVPKAEARAGRINQEALAYQQETELNAEGNANRFNQIVIQYQKAPRVTQSRLYLETMEAIFSKNNKVMVDSGKEGNNLIYIPLDKLVSQSKPTENNEQKADKEKN
jgi:membrane protease subunit HflK